MHSAIRVAVASAIVATATFLISADTTPASEASEVQLRIGDLLFAEGRFSDSLDAYRNALKTAPRFRGVLRLQTEPATGAQTCIVCDQCAKACPDDLIALGGHREPGQKIKVLDYFDFNLSRCSFCGLCSEVCPTKPVKALIMSEDYELGTYSRETQILRIDEMYDGVPIEQYTR